MALVGCLSVAAACTSGGGKGGPNGGGGPDGGTGNPDGGGIPTNGETAPSTRFFLPTGEPDNTSAPVVQVDAAGGTHALYPAYAIGGAYYAYCPAGCAGEQAVSVVKLDTTGTVGNAMLALDANGHPRVLLSSYQRVYYASCDANCTSQEGWKSTPIIEHNAEKEVTGKAFALDPQGRPRFLMHTYVALLGIGQKPPKTEWVTCDANCDAPASWQSSVIAEQIFQESTLRFDASGGAHVATSAIVDGKNIGAYQYCADGCGAESSWSGPSFAEAYENQYEAVSIKPNVTLALTKAGTPRILLLLKTDSGDKRIGYFACDKDCGNPQSEDWRAKGLSDHAKIGEGFDLALDAQDRPRLVYTLDYNIFLAHCEEADCAAETATWGLAKVEAGSEMVADQIFPYPNCNIGAWFLHSPSIAITKDGLVRVGYQSRDISGGAGSPGKECVAGTDMTFARLAILTPL